MDSKASSKESELKTSGILASKRRKVVEKTVCDSEDIGENEGKLKNEGPPSALWSWRKYGPPYTRGYYKCSTSKGCSAKKQVERCRTDGSKLIITYTSSHNHPGQVIVTTDLTLCLKKPQTNHFEEVQNEPIKVISEEDASEGHFHYLQSPLTSPQQILIKQNRNARTRLI